MPSPAWRAAYTRILARWPSELPVYHWGDIDEGGFRIAAVLAVTAQTAGRRLRPWLMSPADIPAETARHAKIPTAASVAAMVRWAERSGWGELARPLREYAMQLEQESLDPLLPS